MEVVSYSEENDYDHRSIIDELYDLGTDDEVHEWLNHWRVMLRNNEPPEVIVDWFLTIKKQKSPHVIGNMSCTEEIFYHYAVEGTLPVARTFQDKCDSPLIYCTK